MRKWFLLNQGHITGPFSSDEVDGQIRQTPDTLLWARGETEWVNIEKWHHLQMKGESPSFTIENKAPEIDASLQNLNFTKKNDSPLIKKTNDLSEETNIVHQRNKPSQETTRLANSKEVEQHTLTGIRMDQRFNAWRIKNGSKESSPMSYAQLLSQLRELSDLNSVLIYDQNKKEWLEIFSFESIINDLGISRRTHDRVPIMGSFSGEHETHGPLQAKVISVSEGGFGLGDAKNLQIGDVVKGTINSPNLFIQITCTAEVVYMSPEGFAGLSFKAIGEEAQSAIIEYVRKFSSIKAAKK